MRTLFSTMLAVLAVLFLGMAPGEAKTKLRAGNVLPPTSDQGQAAEFFAKRVAKLTNGEVEIVMFHSGELGSPPTQFENTIAGAQDMVIETMDYFKAYDDAFGVINTPFVFRDRQHFSDFLNGPAFGKIADKVEDRGLKFLGNYNWMRQQNRGILSRTPIFTPEDLDGYKMRMFQAEMPIQAWSAMGANIQVMAWADVYTALATGAVDSLTTVVSASYLNKHIEVLKYFTDLGEYYQIVLPVISKRSWDKLSESEQAAIQQASIEAGEEYVRLSKEGNDDHIKAAQAELGLTIINPPKGPWLEKADAVHVLLEEKGFLPAGIIAEARAVQ